MPTYTPILEPYIHGQQTTLNGLDIWIVRYYEADWRVWLKRSGVHVACLWQIGASYRGESNAYVSFLSLAVAKAYIGKGL